MPLDLHQTRSLPSHILFISDHSNGNRSRRLPHHLQPATGIVKADGVVDALLDEGSQSDVTPLLPLEPLGLGKLRDAVAAGSLHHLTGDDDARLAHAVDAGVDETLVDLISIQGTCKRRGRGVHHLISDARSLGQDGTQTQTWEHVNVVALVRVVGDDTVNGLDAERLER